MPKVMLSSGAKKDTELRSLIAYHMEREGMSNEKLAAALH